MRGRLDDLQFDSDGRANALNLCQPFNRGGNNAVEIPEPVKKCACDRFDISPRDGAEQKQFQQLIVRNSTRPSAKKPAAKPLAVVGQIRGYSPVLQGSNCRFVTAKK